MCAKGVVKNVKAFFAKFSWRFFRNRAEVQHWMVDILLGHLTIHLRVYSGTRNRFSQHYTFRADRIAKKGRATTASYKNGSHVQEAGFGKAVAKKINLGVCRHSGNKIVLNLNGVRRRHYRGRQSEFLASLPCDEVYARHSSLALAGMCVVS